MGGSLKQNPKNLLVGGFVLFFKQRVTLWHSGKLQSARIHNVHCKPPKYRGCTGDVTAATPSALIQHRSCGLISAPGEVRPPNTRLWNVLRYRTKTIVLQGVEGQKSAHCLPGGGRIHESTESSFLFLACSLAALGSGSVGQKDRERQATWQLCRTGHQGRGDTAAQPASFLGRQLSTRPASQIWLLAPVLLKQGDAARHHTTEVTLSSSLEEEGLDVPSRHPRLAPYSVWTLGLLKSSHCQYCFCCPNYSTEAKPLVTKLDPASHRF